MPASKAVPAVSISHELQSCGGCVVMHSPFPFYLGVFSDNFYGHFFSKRPKEIIMRAGATAWVLGHKVRLLETDESYGLIEVTSPPKVPGPPAHYHKSEREFFLIVKGALDVMTDGVWQTMRAGSYVELPPGSVHTFINNTAEDVVWVTGWRPKGFQKFFDVFGIPVDQDRARERSLSKEVVHQVVESCESFGMYLKV
jgi:quercetin dioxygenase-like cupin family protein